MSVPNKSLDKNKRYAGVKTNDFVNKTRANEANRSAPRPQGWANLGKINNRRIPPPANLPSLKSETGVNTPTFDPVVTTNHGWTPNENSTPVHFVSNPTQQQLDSLPVNPSTPPPPPSLTQQPSFSAAGVPPPPPSDADKSRMPPSWSTITAGTSTNLTEPIPNLLAMNDFPRLATTQDRKSQPESQTNPTFRPANLAIWKEGGGSSRIQPLLNDVSQMLPNNSGANFHQPQMPNMRMYPPQMWAYNPYQQVPMPMYHTQRPHTFNDYRSPTILRTKDIDDLSKITDNTWANSSQEVNYEEKIRFSDDEDENNRREKFDSNNKTQRMKPQILQHPRLIQDDAHLKQMQENKNSELINALTIAKQRREEQERQLRNEHFIGNVDEQKQIPGYQTRPLLSSKEQENYNLSSSSRQSNTSRTRHDTANSQSSFTMKSWSDQMDSFNYASLHEKSGGRPDNDESLVSNKYSRSQSESSSHSHHDNQPLTRKTKKLPLSSKKQQQKPSLAQTKISPKKPLKVDSTDYYDNSNDQWDNWDESTDNRHQQYSTANRPRQPLHSDDLSTQKSNHYNKPSSAKTRNNDRQQPTTSRFKSNSASINKPNQTTDKKSTNNKSQAVWRPLSPNRPSESIDLTPQDNISYRPQQQINDRCQSESYQQQQQPRTNVNDHKQRYQTINTASIPPLMSVRSDAATTAKLYKTANHTNPSHYDDENVYYDSSLQTHQRYHHLNLHNRGYTTLGSYGRYRRSGTLRHQQQYTTYNTNNTSGVSSAPPANTGIRPKKNSTNRPNTTNKKSNQSSSEQTKPLVVDEANSSVEKPKTNIDEVSIVKPNDTFVSSSTTEVLTKENEKKSNGSGNGVSDQKTSLKMDNDNNLVQTENELTKSAKKNTTTTASSNSKRRRNKDQQSYHQDQRYQNQQAPRHRNNYAQSMQEYEAMQMANTHNYYGTSRRTAHGSGGGHNSHMHDLSSNYYYEHPQHYNNRYNYSNEHYQQQQQQQRPTKQHSKRGGTSTTTNHGQQKQPIVNGDSNNNNNNNNFRHHSISDNDQKEGEEWETASESSTNMRNGHDDTSGVVNPPTNEMKSVNRGKTPPKKSFSSQRPNTRQIFKYTNA